MCCVDDRAIRYCLPCIQAIFLNSSRAAEASHAARERADRAPRVAKHSALDVASARFLGIQEFGCRFSSQDGDLGF